MRGRSGPPATRSRAREAPLYCAPFPVLRAQFRALRREVRSCESRPSARSPRVWRLVVGVSKQRPSNLDDQCVTPYFLGGAWSVAAMIRSSSTCLGRPARGASVRPARPDAATDCAISTQTSSWFPPQPRSVRSPEGERCKGVVQRGRHSPWFTDDSQDRQGPSKLSNRNRAGDTRAAPERPERENRREGTRSSAQQQACRSVTHGGTFDELYDVSPMLASHAGLSTAQTSFDDVAAKIGRSSRAAGTSGHGRCSASQPQIIAA